jgi:hypothetical protein
MKVIIFTVLSVLSFSAIANQTYSDDQIRTMIIQNSIANYSGNCPCPYSMARNGSRCGGRSAYSKPGGASPICFPTDVSQQMVSSFRARFQ